MAATSCQTIVRKLYGSSTATTNDLAHLDIPYAARIVGVQFVIQPTAYAANDRVDLELSTAAVGQQYTNDANNVIAMAAYGYTLSTNGGAQVGVATYAGPMSLQIPAGTRLYLHTTQNGTSATRVYALVHIQPA